MPNGTGPEPLAAARASALSSTIRSSSVAVRPMMSFAFAVSCTPGNWTTTRSWPCCWITGSATPSSLTRLCKVVMFCVIAVVWTRRAASGFRLPTSRKSLPSALSCHCRSGSWFSSRLRAATSVSVSRKRTATLLPSREMPVWRMFLSRSKVRMSPVSDSAFLTSADFMSTCIRKYTPPRRSRPRNIGSACSADSQLGDRDSRFSATM